MSTKRSQFEKIAHTLALTATGQTNSAQTKQADLKDLLNSPYAPYVVGGLGGAGLGAVLGTMQPKRKGRNALYYGSLGGLGGLGLAHLWQQAQSGQKGKPSSPAAEAQAPAAPKFGLPPKIQESQAVPPRLAQRAENAGRVVPHVAGVTADGKVELAVTDGGLLPDEIKPYMKSPLYKSGPTRHPLAESAVPAKARTSGEDSDFLEWIETGKLPAHKNLAGRQTQYMDRFRGLLEKFYDETGAPAESMDQLRSLNLLPHHGLEIYENAKLNAPGLPQNAQGFSPLVPDAGVITLINKIRETPGGQDFYLRSGRDLKATMEYVNKVNKGMIEAWTDPKHSSPAESVFGAPGDAAKFYGNLLNIFGNSTGL